MKNNFCLTGSELQATARRAKRNFKRTFARSYSYGENLTTLFIFFTFLLVLTPASFIWFEPITAWRTMGTFLFFVIISGLFQHFTILHYRAHVKQLNERYLETMRELMAHDAMCDSKTKKHIKKIDNEKNRGTFDLTFPPKFTKEDIENILKNKGNFDNLGIKVKRIDITALVKKMVEQGVDAQTSVSFIKRVLSKTDLKLETLDEIMRDLGVMPVYENEEALISFANDKSVLNLKAQMEEIINLASHRYHGSNDEARKMPNVWQGWDAGKAEFLKAKFEAENIDIDHAEERVCIILNNSPLSLDEILELSTYISCKDILEHEALIMELSFSHGISRPKAIAKLLGTRGKVKLLVSLEDLK